MGRTNGHQARRPYPIPQEYERLAQLHEIGKALAHFQSLEEVGPKFLSIMTAALRVRTATLVIHTKEIEQIFTWGPSGLDPAELGQAEQHAKATFADLYNELQPPKQWAYLSGLLPGGRPERQLADLHFITLPLATSAGWILGLFQLEGSAAFDEPDLLFINAVTNELTSAIERHQAVKKIEEAHAEAERTNRRLHQLQEVARAALTGVTLDQALPPLLQVICALFATDAATVLLLAEDGKTLKQRASVDLSEARPISDGDGIAAAVVDKIAAAGAVMSFDDLAAVEGQCPTLQATGLRSLMGAPMQVGGQLVGVLHTATRERRCFTALDKDFLQLVADRIAAIIEHARLYDAQTRLNAALDAERKKFQFLAESSSDFAQSLDPEETLRSLAQRTVATMADLCVIDLLDDNHKVIRRVASTCTDPQAEQALRKCSLAPLPLDESHPAARALRSGRPELVTDPQGVDLNALALSAEHREALRGLRLASVLVVPITMRGQQLGTITLGASAPGRFGPDEVALSTEVTHRAALALDNARLYQQARAAIRSRDDLMGVVAHELSNPLNAILLNEEVFGKRADPRAQAHVALVKRSVERMKRLIGDLRDISAIEAARLTLDKRAESVSAMVHDALAAASSAAATKTIALRTRLPQDELRVFCDRGRILQVLANLLSNAIKFTEAGGAITLTVAPWDNGTARFSVADTGCGLTAEQLPHVFEPYWQAPQTARLGTGLGLAITKAIVEAHGGQISAESRVGAGTSFHFTLPLSLS